MNAIDHFRSHALFSELAPEQLEVFDEPTTEIFVAVVEQVAIVVGVIFGRYEGIHN